jgi:tetratricopeptide (TPR) repeat protein
VVVSSVAVAAGLAVQYVRREIDPRLLPHSHRSLRAFVHYVAGDYAAAARLYRADLAARVSPKAPPWWAAYLAGDLAAAEQLLRQDLKDARNDVEILLSFAEIALAGRRFKEALDLTTTVLELRRDDYDALLIAAAARARLGAPGDAIDALNRALRHNRTGRRVTVFLATLELTGDLHDSPTSSPCLLAHLHRYLRIFDPSHARIAERYAREAMAAGDRVDDAYVTLGVIFERTGRRREALEAFRRGAAVNPRNVHALRGAARRHADRGEIAEEYRFLRQAAEAAPHDALVMNGYHGFLTGKLGDYPQALALDRAAVARNPLDSEAWWRLGTVQSYLGDRAAALTAHRRATTLAPDNPLFQDHIAHELFLLERFDEARVAYQTSIRLDPARPAPHTGLATIHARHERWGEARQEYEIANALGEADVEMLVNLCQVYQAMHDDSRAFNCLSRVLTRDPDNVRGRVLLEHAGAALAVKR